MKQVFFTFFVFIPVTTLARSVSINLDWSDNPLSLSSVLGRALFKYGEANPSEKLLTVSSSANGANATLEENVNRVSCDRRAQEKMDRYRCTFRLETTRLEWTHSGESFQSVLGDALVKAKLPGIDRETQSLEKGTFDVIAIGSPGSEKKDSQFVACAAAMQRDELHCWFRLNDTLIPESGMNLDGYQFKDGPAPVVY